MRIWSRLEQELKKMLKIVFVQILKLLKSTVTVSFTRINKPSTRLHVSNPLESRLTRPDQSGSDSV